MALVKKVQVWILMEVMWQEAKERESIAGRHKIVNTNKDIIEIIRSNKVRLTNIQQDLIRLVEEKATDHCALAMYKQSEVGSVVSDMCLGIHMEAEINILNLFARLNPILAQEFLN